MGVFDNIYNKLKIGEPEEDFDDYDDYEEPESDAKVPEVKEEPVSKVRSFERKPLQPAPRKKVSMSDSSLRVFKPKAFDEAKEIAETLLNNYIVLLNFEGVDIAVSQRILDIITGACIAINGNLQKLSNYIFIATPSNVDVSGEFQDTLSDAFDSL